MKLPPRGHGVTLVVAVLLSVVVQALWPEPGRAMRAALFLVVLAAFGLPTGLLAGQVAGRIASEAWRTRYRRARANESHWRYRALSAEAQLEIRQTLNAVRGREVHA